MTNPRFGPGDRELICDGRAVAPLAVADTPAARRKGLLGTSGIDGALWITKCPSVHMVGMKYPIDVALLDRHDRVLKVRTLRPPFGMTMPNPRVRSTLEAPAGALAEWGVTEGATLGIGPS